MEELFYLLLPMVLLLAARWRLTARVMLCLLSGDLRDRIRGTLRGGCLR